MVHRRLCAVCSALAWAALLSILVPACNRDEETSPSVTPFSCHQRTCTGCTHEAACFWSRSRKSCQTGIAGCAGLDCVNDDSECKR